MFRWLLGAFFVAAGVTHFTRPELFLKIVPPYLPFPEALVAVSGGCEIVLGVLAVVPKTAPVAGWGLVGLLIAVFPANVHMALNADRYPDLPAAGLWARLPFQAVLIAWAWWATRVPLSQRGPG